MWVTPEMSRDAFWAQLIEPICSCLCGSNSGSGAGS
ncbi:hypothetical protein HNR40_007518 [Nonomuraea endophytica]|uniref:Uncharacterized protein n=1 Tax=Nonomuraea endophytica TaxID=714136 RepID=A0A7W8AC39_9ACTN|nr:hypothetical protein [Nonomuraea endophytica]